MGWHRRSLHVPVDPCVSLCSLDSFSSPCSGCTRGMLSPPGRGEVVEAKHGSIPVPWLGLGDPGGLQGCCQLPEVPVLRHRSSPAQGWSTELLSQQDHWVTSLGTGEAPVGIWGRDGPRGMEPPLKYSELGCSPHYLWQGHHGLLWPPRGRGGHILPLRGDSCAGSPRGTVQRIVQGSARAPQTPPSQESSPRSQAHPAIRWERGQLQKASSSSGVTACPEAQWGAEGFGVIPPKQ